MLKEGYPQLKPDVCLRGHSAQAYDTEKNFVLHRCSPPFIYRYVSEDVYEILREFDGSKSLAAVLDAYEEADAKEILAFLADPELEPFFGMHRGPRSRPADWDLRVRPVNTRTLLPLNSLHFHASNKCNFKCKHCYHAPYSGNSRVIDLSLAQVRDFFAVLHRNNVSFVYFSGGEPLLNKQLLSYFRELRKLRIPYGFISNFSLLDEKLLEEIVAIGGCREINTSLDGPAPEIHDSYRRAPGNFRKILEMVPTVLGTGIKVNLNTSIHRGWIGREAEWVPLLLKMGVRHWRTEYSAPTGNFLSNKDDIGLDRQELLDFYDRIEKTILGTELKSRLQTYMVGRHRRKVEGGTLEFTAGTPVCLPHIDLMFLEANGDIPYCSLFSQQFPVYGNLKTDDPIEVWNKISKSRLENRLGKLECGGCRHLGRCGGGCPGTWKDPRRFAGCDLENRFVFDKI